jgi:hypothetical protein
LVESLVQADANARSDGTVRRDLISELPDGARLRSKNISLFRKGKSMYKTPISPDRGALRIVTDAVWDAVDA